MSVISVSRLSSKSTQCKLDIDPKAEGGDESDSVIPEVQHSELPQTSKEVVREFGQFVICYFKFP